MVYNLTAVDNADNMIEILAGINTASGGLVGGFIVFSVFALCFITFKRMEDDTLETFLVSSTLTSVTSVILWAAGVVTWQVVILPVLAMVFSFIMYQIKGGSS